MADDAVAEAIAEARDCDSRCFNCGLLDRHAEALLLTLADECERLREGWRDLQAAVLNLARQRDDFDAERRMAEAERDAALAALKAAAVCFNCGEEMFPRCWVCDNDE